MYWPQNVATRVLQPHLRTNDEPQPEGANGDAPGDLDAAIHLSANTPYSHPSYFILLTKRTIHVYSSRPAVVVASLQRTARSLREYGLNKRAWWRLHSQGRSADIAVETTRAYILIYAVQHATSAKIYALRPVASSSKTPYAPSAKSLRQSFAATPGEASASWATANHELRVGMDGAPERAVHGSPALQISMKMALRVDAGLASCLATPGYLLIATTNPPAIQMIPWPEDPSGKQIQTEQTSYQLSKPKTTLLSSLPWFHSEPTAPISPLSPEPRQSGSFPPSSQATIDHEGHAIHLTQMVYSRVMDSYVWVASDGRAYVTSVDADLTQATWKGRCFHGSHPRRRRSLARSKNAPTSAETPARQRSVVSQDTPRSTSPALCASINVQMGLLTVGQVDGSISVYVLRSQSRAVSSHILSLRTALRSTASSLSSGPVQTLQWTSDGLALAVGWEKGWAVWSAWGKLMGHSFTHDAFGVRNKHFADVFMDGVRDLFWGPGGTELFVLAGQRQSQQQQKSFKPSQLFIIPHAKSAVAGQHSPDNTRFAFIQLDDALLVYRGSEQPDMSIINPDSDVWQHIKIPQDYLSTNWPVRYASISPDGLLIAVSGRRGLAHYSATSGRWKAFTYPREEESFVVRGGMQWFEHVLIVACQPVDPSSGTVQAGVAQLRLYSRDADLQDANLLHRENISSPIVLTSLFEDSLLVYTTDNTLYHFLIIITQDDITLQLCGSITFEGVVGEPERVRGLSWMIPKSQQQFGDPMDDLTVATVIFLVDGKLVLLRPRKGASVGPATANTTFDPSEEVAYDMQILGDRIEYYWTHLSGIGTLENSLWGYDGSGIKLWLDALTIEHAKLRQNASVNSSDEEAGQDAEEDIDEDEMPEYKTIEESLSMPLDFYPLCVVLEKGIVIGVEPEVSVRKNLDFAIFRAGTATHLFLDRLLRYYLEQGKSREAVVCANSYRQLVYFAHALEVLLHGVLEDEADAAGQGVLQHQCGDDKTVADDGIPASGSSGSIIEHSLSSSLSASFSIASQVNASAAHHPTDMIANIGVSATVSQPQGKTSGPLLPVVIDFLDYFDEALSVIVNCARKTEVVRWGYLFSHLGAGVTPRGLFETCLERGDFRTAGSYLLVLHTMYAEGRDDERSFDGHSDSKEELTARLLRMVLQAEKFGLRGHTPDNSNWSLCRDLLRYTRSMDESGCALRRVVELASLLEDEEVGNGEESSSAQVGAHVSTIWRPADSTRTSRSYRHISNASSFTLDTPQEEEEDEEFETKTEKSSEEVLERKNVRHLRELSSALSSAPPVPTVSVNGRVLPSPLPSSSPMMQRTPSGGGLSSSSAPFPAHGFFPSQRSSDNTAAASSQLLPSGPNASGRAFSIPPPAGMRLTSGIHQVGLRSSLSTDHLFARSDPTSPFQNSDNRSNASYFASANRKSEVVRGKTGERPGNGSSGLSDGDEQTWQTGTSQADQLPAEPTEPRIE